MREETDNVADDTLAKEMRRIRRDSTVSASRALNTSLDAVFYDTEALSRKERSSLTTYTRPEGSVLIVPPGDSKQPIDTLMPWQFVAQQNDETSPPVDAIAVAGVGSSALGTAALARNVADFLGRPVAAVVSGFGISDLMSEALGGWFVLGARNAMRDALARVFDAYGLEDHVRDDQSHREMEEQFESMALEKDGFVYGSPDSASLLYLLSKLGTRIKLLVGHSKGSLSIENALQGLLVSCKRTGMPVHTDVCVVTLGAVTRFPDEFQNVHQFLGTIDYLGMLNSRLLVPRIDVPCAWHSLNSKLLGHLSVRRALQAAEVR